MRLKLSHHWCEQIDGASTATGFGLLKAPAAFVPNNCSPHLDRIPFEVQVRPLQRQLFFRRIPVNNANSKIKPCGLSRATLKNCAASSGDNTRCSRYGTFGSSTRSEGF